jgi:hypothetical protein
MRVEPTLRAARSRPWYGQAVPVDPPPSKPSEAEVAALIASAQAVRKRPSRGLWMLAIVVSLVCVLGLGYGLLTYWDTEPDKAAVKASGSSNGSGFGIGLMIGLGAGIAIGCMLALRRRQP